MRFNKYIRTEAKKIPELRLIMDHKQCKHVHDLWFIVDKRVNEVARDKIIDFYGDIIHKFRNHLCDIMIDDHVNEKYGVIYEREGEND